MESLWGWSGFVKITGSEAERLSLSGEAS